MHILFCLSYLLILWTISKSNCVTCSRILPASVCCVLQGSGVTPLKCGKIYDIDFVANFVENMTVKNLENWSAFLKLERMYNGTVFIETRCIWPVILCKYDGTMISMMQWYIKANVQYSAVSQQDSSWACNFSVTNVIGKSLCLLGLTLLISLLLADPCIKKVEKWLKCGVKIVRNGVTLSCINGGCLLIVIYVWLMNLFICCSKDFN